MYFKSAVLLLLVTFIPHKNSSKNFVFFLSRLLLWFNNISSWHFVSNLNLYLRKKIKSSRVEKLAHNAHIRLSVLPFGLSLRMSDCLNEWCIKGVVVVRPSEIFGQKLRFKRSESMWTRYFFCVAFDTFRFFSIANIN